MSFDATMDARFGDATEPIEWAAAAAVLSSAELYWLTTVRKDGRPHTVPLVGVWVDDAFVFCTGKTEQKYRNLDGHPTVTVTTGVNTWSDGLDVVVEGSAARVTGASALQALADAYREKYGDDWSFTVSDEVFDPDGESAHVFRVTPAKVLAFAKSPHGQTRFTPIP